MNIKIEYFFINIIIITIFKTPNDNCRPSIFELTKYKLDQLEKFTEHPKFNKDLPTVVYVHGWIEDGEDEKSVMAVRGAYHDRGGHNIITIDWSHYSKLNFPFVYKTPIQNLKVVS